MGLSPPPGWADAHLTELAEWLPISLSTPSFLLPCSLRWGWRLLLKSPFVITDGRAAPWVRGWIGKRFRREGKERAVAKAQREDRVGTERHCWPERRILVGWMQKMQPDKESQCASRQ